MASRGVKRGMGRGGSNYTSVGGYGGAYAGYTSGAGAAGYDAYDYYGYAPGAGQPLYGTGYPPAGPGMGVMSAQAQGMVHGTHTSSKDPQSVKSRVFVGNLNTKLVSRDQLERLYARFGAVVGLSIHKGFAFVQFTTEAHARSAVSFTDGMTLCGQIIDVNISDEPKDGNTSSAAANGGASQAKRGRFEAGLDAQEELLEYPGNPDFMLCGHCKAKFTAWKPFLEHRKQPCMKSDAEQMDSTGGAGVEKPEGEPAAMNCFICKNAFPHSWGLIVHLGEKHNMQVVGK